MKKKFRINWSVKLFMLLFIFSVLPVLILSFSVIQDIEKKFYTMTLTNLGGLARTKVQVVDQFITDRVRQVERIATLVSVDLDLVIQDMEKGLIQQAGELTESKKSQTSQQVSKIPSPVADPSATVSESRDNASPSSNQQALDSEKKNSPEQPAPGNKDLPEPSTIYVKPAIKTEPDKPAVLPEAGSGAKVNPVKSEEALDEQKQLRKSLGLILWDQKDYEELLIINPEGIVLVSTFDAHEGKSAVNIDYFQKGLRSTYIQNVFISPITERLTMVVATPVKNANQRIIGVLAARLNLKTFFRLIEDQVGLGKTGETIVARQVESEFVFMAPTRHNAEAALNLKIAAGDPISQPLQEAARGQSGIGPAIDYRHVDVFEAWQHIPSLDWGLVVKIDQQEALSDVKEMKRKTVIIAVGILLLVLVCSALISKALVAPLIELKDTADKVSKGDLDVKLSINSSDEVGDLADSFERMIAAIKFFKDKTD